MQTVAKNNLILTKFPSLNGLAELRKQISHAEFYQHITEGLIKGFYTEQVLAGLGDGLITLAEHAYRLRRMAEVEQSSLLLLSLPLSGEYRSVGHYYKASCLHRKGQLDEERALLNPLIEELPPKFRARALVSLSATYGEAGDFQSFLSLCVEAGRAATRQGFYDPQSLILSQRNIAVIKSINGDHHGALADLEEMLPLVRVVGQMQPYLFYEQLNSYAVELGEVGRLEEARNICKIVLASPCAGAYPEWRETGDEITLRGYRSPRSFVSTTQRILKKNVVRLPIPERKTGPAESAPQDSVKSSRVLDYVEWTKNMVKEPNDTPQDDKPSEELDEREKLLRIIHLASARERTEQELDSILEAIEKIIPPQKDEDKK